MSVPDPGDIPSPDRRRKICRMLTEGVRSEACLTVSPVSESLQKKGYPNSGSL